MACTLEEGSLVAPNIILYNPVCERQPGKEAAAVVAPNIILHNLCVTLARCFFLYANVWDGNFFQGELFFITERTGFSFIN